MRRMIFAVVALAIVATACGSNIESGVSPGTDPGPSGTATTDPAPSYPPAKLVRKQPANCQVKATTDTKVKPVITIPDCTPSTDLIAVDLVVGTGAELKAGQNATINYVGQSWSTKAEFDASWGKTPFSTTIPGGLIDGWNEGIPGMKIGGRRLLVIPPSKGYGATGAGDAIAPNETLVFVVDLIGAK